MPQSARLRGLPVTAEVTAHHLTFDTSQVPPGATQFKCAPPLRGADNQQQLAAALLGGKIQAVSSDHSPSHPDLKKPDG